MIRFAFAAQLLVVLFGGCSQSSSSSTDGGAGAVDLYDFDAAPGTLGASCDIFVGARLCGDGLHCGVGKKAGATQDICIPNTASPLVEGAPCTSVDFDNGVVGDRCEPGHACIRYAGASTCLRLCTQRSDCATSEVCAAPTGSASVPAAQTIAGCVKSDACDAIAKTGCPSNLSCYLARDNVTRFFTCQDAGTAQITEPCASSRDCAPGLNCSSLGFCRTLCYVNPPGGGTQGLCAATEPACMRIAGAPDNYGVCDTP